MIKECKTPGCHNDVALKEYRPDGSPKYRTLCNACRTKKRLTGKPLARVVAPGPIRIKQTENTPDNIAKEEHKPRPKIDVDPSFIDAQYAQLRSRLLDLSRRNPLINFNHSRTGTRYIRVVDEVPEVLFERIVKGEMEFIALPDTDAEPTDEKTDSFQSVLELGKMMNAEYRSALEDEELQREDGIKYQEQLNKAERILRDRIREDLKMPKLQTQATLDIRAHARIHGFDPSFELSSEVMAEHHEDDYIQCLLTSDSMDRRLRNVYSNAVEFERDTGINVLTTIFGFLEWKVSENSDEKNLSPLILVPTAIDRKRSKKAYLYKLSCDGDLPTVNTTLGEKLSAEIGIELPEYDPEGSLEEYFSKIELIAAEHKGWALRRFVTVGICPFSTISINRDLIPEHWNEDDFYNHPTVADLFAARKRGDGGVNDLDDIDQLTISGQAPPLVLNADSSQHTAIRKALDGESIVIEGPPGTGKSQTIANIIAAATAQGKRILFVAEKQPALDVVANRLREVGLAPLMLEPQRKGSKLSFVESLRSRLKSEINFSKQEYAKQRERLSDSITQLNRSKSLLGKSTPYLGLTLFDLIWRHIRSAQEFNFQPAHPARLGLNFESFSERQYEELLELTDRYFTFIHPRIGERNSLEGFQEISPNRLHVAAFRDECESILDSIDQCERFISTIPRSCFRDRKSSKEFIESIREDPVENWMSIEDIDNEIEEHNQSMEELSQAKYITEEYRRLGFLDINAASLISGGLKALGRERVILSDLIEEIKENELLFGKLKQYSHTCEKYNLPLKLKIPEVEVAVAAIARIKEYYPSSHQLFQRGVDLEAFASQIKIIEETLSDVSNLCKNSIKQDLVEFFNTYSSAEIEYVKEAYKDAGVFSFLSSKFRKAKRILKQLHIEYRNEIDLIQQLGKLAEAFTLLEKLKESKDTECLIGDKYQGLETNISSLKEELNNAVTCRDSHSKLNDYECNLDLAEIYEASLADESLDEFKEIRLSRSSKNDDAISHQLESQAVFIGDLFDLSRNLDAAGIAESEEIDLVTISKFLRGKNGCTTTEDIFAALEAFVGLCNRAQAIINESPRSETESLSEIAALERKKALQNKHARCLGLINPDDLLEFVIRTDLDKLLNAAWDGIAECESFITKFGYSEDTWTPKSEAWTTELKKRVQNILKIDASEIVSDAERLNVGKDIDASIFGQFFKSKEFLGFSDAPRSLCFCELAITSAMLIKLAEEHGLDREEFTGYATKITKNQFREYDEKLRSLDAQFALSVGLERTVPRGVGHGPKRDWTELSLIRNECVKQTRFLPIRELVRRAKGALLQMKPIWLMQPLTVSQMLPKTVGLFDIVLIDEASQMLPEMAVASILRGNQTVVVGDDKQMPPSSFFKSSAPQEEEEQEIECESILDLASGRFKEKVSLRWHYRSKHESLIQFSNNKFYKNMLEVIPAANHPGGDLGVEHIKAEGAYKGGVNYPEAMVLIESVRRFMIEHPDRSLGIVTMNSKQKDLVEEELLRLADTDRDVRNYFDRWSETILDYPMVRSLERVQGDERDAIFISTVYGPDSEGKMFQRFPLINTDFGHRRLNVLFTRARRKVVLVTSMNPSDIKLDNSSKLGKKALRDYIEYAATGRLETGEVTGETADSDFEIAVSESLETAGYKVTPQVGVRGFRIDLGVEHEDSPNGYLAGIECDGATYHSSPFARDRDAIRQDILESLGWKIYRVWSTDWFKDANRETEKMLQWLAEVREPGRAVRFD